MSTSENPRKNWFRSSSRAGLWVVPEWKYTLQETDIYPGTTIFLYTDGLTEAENIKHEQFRMERVNEVAALALADNQQ